MQVVWPNIIRDEQVKCIIKNTAFALVWFVVLNATFSNISVIS